jgi:hypothetical protein
MSAAALDRLKELRAQVPPSYFRAARSQELTALLDLLIAEREPQDAPAGNDPHGEEDERAVGGEARCHQADRVIQILVGGEPTALEGEAAGLLEGYLPDANLYILEGARLRTAIERSLEDAQPAPAPVEGEAPEPVSEVEEHVLRLLAAGQATTQRGVEWLTALRRGEAVDLPPVEEDEVLVPDAPRPEPKGRPVWRLEGQYHAYCPAYSAHLNVEPAALREAAERWRFAREYHAQADNLDTARELRKAEERLADAVADSAAFAAESASPVAVDGELREVLALAAEHAHRWVDRDGAYWCQRLMQEVGELASALAGDHDDSPEHELRQVASIAINWLRLRAAAEGGRDA